MARDQKNQSENARLGGKSSVGDAIRHGVQMNDSALARLQQNGADIADPVTVHHFRTAMRRMRSLLSSFKDASPPGARKRLSNRLKDTAQRYGEMRQWDALISTLDKAEKGPGSRVRAQVREAAEKQRHALGEYPLRRDIGAVDRAISGATWLQRPANGDAELWNEQIGDYAEELLDRQWRKLRKNSRTLDLSDPAAFHKFRIAAKKHRYTIEFLSSLYRKKDVKPYLERVIALQDALGEIRDAMAAEALIGQLDVAPQIRDSAQKWLERRANECRKRLPAQGKAFRREAPFWER